MASCDICGKEDRLVEAIVNGANLSVCSACAKYGKVLNKPKVENLGAEARRSLAPKPAQRIEEPDTKIVEDYAQVLKAAREKKGITHEDLSKRIGEKESMLHKIESGHMVPPIAVARKLEKFFGVKLVDEEKEDKLTLARPGGGPGLTLGDFLKKK